MTHHHRKRSPFTTPLLVLGVVLATGCEEDLAGRNSLESPFAMYGVLSPDLDVQSILVFPVEDFPVTGHPEPLDAVVTSTDLNTGEVRTWMDSVSVDAEGRAEYVFWSDFEAEYGHTYQIEAARLSDGAASTATVRVPPRVAVEPEDTGQMYVPLRIRGEALRVLTPLVQYSVRLPGPPPGSVCTYTLSYAGRERETEDGWEVGIRLFEDIRSVQSWYAHDTGALIGITYPSLALVGMQVFLIVGDEVWDPADGIFDPDELGFPGVIDNVENGFGFIGGGYKIQQRLELSQEAVERTGYYYRPDLHMMQLPAQPSEPGTGFCSPPEDPRR